MENSAADVAPGPPVSAPAGQKVGRFSPDQYDAIAMASYEAYRDYSERLGIHVNPWDQIATVFQAREVAAVKAALAKADALLALTDSGTQAAAPSEPPTGEERRRLLLKFSYGRATAVLLLIGETFAEAEYRWAPKLAGQHVRTQPDGLKLWGYPTKADALDAARAFREGCRRSLGEDVGPPLPPALDPAQQRQRLLG